VTVSNPPPPDAATPLCTAARRHIAAGRPQDALALLDRALALAPLSATAFADRGTTLAMLERFEPALADLQRALALGYREASLCCTLGNVCTAQRGFDDALGWYAKAIQLDPNYALTYYNRGHLFRQMGRHAAALADFQKCLSFNPEGPLRERIELRIASLREAARAPR
jgi:tetratricopeptide (TPR) repeat protein